MNRGVQILLCLVLLGPACASAHKPSTSYLMLESAGEGAYLQWEIAVRDLQYVVGLDADRDGAITWGELRARHAAVSDYALDRIDIFSGDDRCPLTTEGHALERHSDGAYAVMRIRVACPRSLQPTRLSYDLLFDRDPTHRGLLRLASGDEMVSIVLSPDRREARLQIAGENPWSMVARYWATGIWHIWAGVDHILFLLVLVLPLARAREPVMGSARETDQRSVSTEVFKVVTAFTVAHSITLIMAVGGYLNLPSRLVESSIAATVLLAAINNLRRPVWSGRASLAFGCGLVHGLGFASVLLDSGLSAKSLALALVAFNLGVECGQVVFVAILASLALLLRKRLSHWRLALSASSLAVAGVALVWLAERALDVAIFGA